MAKLRKTNRLSAPLMFAFRSAHEARDARVRFDQRGEDGERVVTSRKSPAQAAITEPLLRREVSRDLECLMNTIALESTQDLRGFDKVRASVLNFGMPDIAHRTIDELTVGDIKDEIETVLDNFEPRLIPGSIHVVRDRSVDSTALKVRFLVRADLSCKPIDVPVEFTADVEVDSGKVVISRL
jgi:type VI secretion system protein ImpF